MSIPVEPILGTLISAAVIAIWRTLLWPLPAKYRAFKSDLIQTLMDASRTDLTQLQSDLERIKEQLRPNHGTSLRDVADKLMENYQSLANLIEYNEMKRRAIEGARGGNAAIWECDSRGDLIYLSAQVMQWTGRQFYELQGSRWLTIIAPEMREVCAEWWKDTISHAVYAEMHQLHLDYQARRFPVKVRAIPVFSPDHSTLVGYVGTIERLPMEPPSSPSLPERSYAP